MGDLTSRNIKNPSSNLKISFFVASTGTTPSTTELETFQPFFGVSVIEISFSTTGSSGSTDSSGSTGSAGSTGSMVSMSSNSPASSPVSTASSRLRRFKI